MRDSFNTLKKSSVDVNVYREKKKKKRHKEM